MPSSAVSTGRSRSADPATPLLAGRTGVELHYEEDGGVSRPREDPGRRQRFALNRTALERFGQPILDRFADVSNLGIYFRKTPVRVPVDVVPPEGVASVWLAR